MHKYTKTTLKLTLSNEVYGLPQSSLSVVLVAFHVVKHIAGLDEKFHMQ
jgi:hypothetical protein